MDEARAAGMFAVGRKAMASWRIAWHVASSAGFGLWATSAEAQYLAAPIPISASIPDASMFLAKNSLAPNSPFLMQGNDYVGVPAGTWMIYPMVASSFQYDDNILDTHVGRIADISWILSPTFIATRNEGIQNTLVYGTLDSNSYFNDPKADYTNGRVGFEHVWEARRDLVFNITGDLLRSTEVSTGGDAFGGTPFYPIQSTEARGSISMLKSMGPWFSDTSASLSDTTYANSAFGNGQPLYQNYRDFSEGTITQRVGYSFDSNFYAYEDSTLDAQNMYLSPETNSTGVRQTVGVGALQYGTLGGELFAGFQERHYVSDRIGAISDPVFGGRVSWEPRKYLIFSAAADETLQTATMITPANPVPSAMKVEDFGLSATYSVSPNWQTGLNLKYENGVDLSNNQTLHAISTGINWQYTVNRAFILTASLLNNRVLSSVAATGYVADIMSIGLTYRY